MCAMVRGVRGVHVALGVGVGAAAQGEDEVVGQAVLAQAGPL
jgi:hypothetical protein